MTRNDEFGTISFYETFGTTGHFALDLNGLTATGQVHAQNMTQDSVTGDWVGTGAVRVTARDPLTGEVLPLPGGRLVNDPNAKFTVSVQSPPPGMTPNPRITAFPLDITIECVGSDGNPAKFTTEASPTFLVVGGNAECFVNLSLVSGA